MSTKLTDDRTTRARIRDAAIQCFAENGVFHTTVRKVATAANVAPGSVIHHFGSMEGLRVACDEYVASAIRESKRAAMSAGLDLDVLATLREAEVGSLAGYLSAVLSDDSPVVAKLVDDMVADAEGYLEQGVETGMIRPSADPRGRATVLMLWSLGALVMHAHLKRILGVDLTDPEADPSTELAPYAGPAYEIFSGGVFSDAFAARSQDVFKPPSGEATAHDESVESD